jgi:GH35 family endo-1,4-beta-xylanase
MLVMFDDCWNPEGHLGPQPAPIPSVHNSQWVQSPGASEYVNNTMYPTYKMYFLDIIGQFRDDPRVYLWDIYNEPGNSAHYSTTLQLLRNAFMWARQANPSQPISSGVWNWDL